MNIRIESCDWRESIEKRKRAKLWWWSERRFKCRTRAGGRLGGNGETGEEGKQRGRDEKRGNDAAEKEGEEEVRAHTLHKLITGALELSLHHEARGFLPCEGEDGSGALDAGDEDVLGGHLNAHVLGLILLLGD